MIKHQQKLRRLWPLLLLIVFIIFPLAWLGMVWQSFGIVLGGIFPSDAQHALGHIGLFFLLGLLALYFFPVLRTRPWLYVSLILVGVLQEGMQLLYKLRPFVFDDWRDLGTDLLGLLLAYLVVWLWHFVRRSKKEVSLPHS